jgi:hypothetical protein
MVRVFRSEGVPVRFVQSAALIAVTAVLAVSLGSFPATANPIPVCFFFVHVHPWQTNFCTTNPITQCNQVVQHTETEGDMEFDFYMDNRNLHYVGIEQYQDVRLDVRWTPGWTYQYAANCPSGYVDEELYPERAILDFHFDPPVSTGGQEVKLFGRVRMHVSGFGYLSVYQGEIDGSDLGCGSNDALAGVECDYWVTDCGWWRGCGADLTPEVLNLEVLQGDLVQGTLDARIGWYHMEGPCPVTFSEDEPYMALEVQGSSPDHANVVITVDSSQLPLGVTEGVVRADGYSRDCATVVVTVLENSAVPPGDSEQRLVSWGKIKSLYRE